MKSESPSLNVPLHSLHTCMTVHRWEEAHNAVSDVHMSRNEIHIKMLRRPTSAFAVLERTRKFSGKHFVATPTRKGLKSSKKTHVKQHRRDIDETNCAAA